MHGALVLWCLQSDAVPLSPLQDLRFAAGNRVFLPFRKILDDWCDPFTIATHTDRMNLIDVDGHEQLDISGSYGVNVVGYDRYKEFITKGWEDMKDLGCIRDLGLMLTGFRRGACDRLYDANIALFSACSLF